MENTNPKTFTNVRVFAGDKVKPAANASYRNLLWENFHVDHSFDFGAKIVADKEIGTIDSWGPFFRVSFDLIIHSLRQEEWSSLLAFRGNGAICDNCKIGDRVPVLFLNNKDCVIQFSNTVNNLLFDVELNNWYNIIIERKSVNGKVVY